eukprot:Gb_10282 [translate_table: standard]
MVNEPPSSKLSTLITPSSASKEYLRDRTPKPTGLSLKSTATPIALVKCPLPSERSSTLSPTPMDSAHALSTNASLTDTQAIKSTPLARS